jgi:hypothetical protein
VIAEQAKLAPVLPERRNWWLEGIRVGSPVAAEHACGESLGARPGGAGGTPEEFLYRGYLFAVVQRSLYSSIWAVELRTESPYPSMGVHLRLTPPRSAGSDRSG